MPIIVAQDDAIIRTAQVILDPDTDPDRQAGIADYYSVDLDDFDGFLAEIRGSAPGLFPATFRMVDDQESFRDAIKDADGTILESFIVGEEELAAAPNLKIIQKFGVDLRNIDLDACARHNVVVKPLRRRVNVAVAEHAFALMMALAKKIVSTHGRLDEASLRDAGYQPKMYDRRHVASANWARVGGLVTLQGSTLGVLGFGEIGRELAERAKAFNMNILYHQRNQVPADIEAALGARYVSFEELLEQSDFMTIQLPLTPSTEGMIDKAAFARMKPGAFLVNISRAAIVDRDALIGALESGRLGGAGIDVHYKEPGDADEPLKNFDNVVLSPHIAVASRMNGAADMEELVANLAEAVS
jgi:lactate dehydrogenase-like 2-hydroxyacid dehydrogenase